MKICNKCNTSKETNEFRKHKNVCKECERKTSLKYYYKRKSEDPKFLENCYKKDWEKRRTTDGCKYALYNRAKIRAKKRGLEFSICQNDIVIPKNCPILGIELKVSDEKMSDSSPSLDRINSNMGYVKGNIQVISAKANTIKNNATLEEVEKVYLFLKSLALDKS